MARHVEPPSDLDILRDLYHAGVLTEAEARIYVVFVINPDKSLQSGLRRLHKGTPDAIPNTERKVRRLIAEQRALLQSSRKEGPVNGENRGNGPIVPVARRARVTRS